MTVNSEIVNASTEELEKELQKRNKSRFAMKNKEDIIASRDENNYVEGYVWIPISDLINNNGDDCLYIISEELIGCNLLMDITYDIVGCETLSNRLILKVRGNVGSLS